MIVSFLPKVSLGLPVLQVQLARRESLAAMASLGQRARRASQVGPVPVSHLEPADVVERTQRHLCRVPFSS